MDDQLIVYRRFTQLALSESLISVLEHNNIVYELEDNSIRINPLVDNDEMSQEYLVKIKQGDFEKVNQLSLDNEKQYLDELEPDYYLLEFTNEELMDVLIHFDEWNSFDVALARKLLTERDQPIDDEIITEIKNNRLAFLQKPESAQTFWVILGYVTALLGGILGVFIGWHLSRHKKTMPNGDKIYAYSANDRKQGNRILIFSILVWVVLIVLKIVNAY